MTTQTAGPTRRLTPFRRLTVVGFILTSLGALALVSAPAAHADTKENTFPAAIYTVKVEVRGSYTYSSISTANSAYYYKENASFVVSGTHYDVPLPLTDEGAARPQSRRSASAVSENTVTGSFEGQARNEITGAVVRCAGHLQDGGGQPISVAIDPPIVGQGEDGDYAVRFHMAPYLVLNAKRSGCDKFGNSATMLAVDEYLYPPPKPAENGFAYFWRTTSIPTILLSRETFQAKPPTYSKSYVNGQGPCAYVSAATCKANVQYTVVATFTRTCDPPKYGLIVYADQPDSVFRRWPVTGTVCVTVVKGTSGNDVLKGTSGPDLIIGYGGNDTISGLGGNDRIFDGAGNDTVSGGDGRDVFMNGTGADRFGGGTDIDTVKYTAGTSGVTVSANNVANDGNGADGPSGKRDNVLTDVENIWGTDYNDVMSGSAQVNRIFGLGGSDWLSGSGGNDYVLGGTGADKFYGGDGNDYLSAKDNTADLEISGGNGTDQASVDNIDPPTTGVP